MKDWTKIPKWVKMWLEFQKGTKHLFTLELYSMNCFEQPRERGVTETIKCCLCIEFLLLGKYSLYTVYFSLLGIDCELNV